MSFTGVYGPLTVALDRPYTNPKILDADRWAQLGDHDQYGIIFEQQKVMTTWQGEGYPRTEWDLLVGFRSFEETSGLNIDRLAIPYTDSFWEFWSLVSEVCEPFEFIHSAEDHHWPWTSWRTFEGEDGPHEIGAVYRLRWADGELESFERGGVEFSGFQEAERP